MASICPPHHWDVDMEAYGGVYHARCRKCLAETTYPARIELELEKVTTVSINRHLLAELEPAEKTEKKRRGRPPKWA